MNCKEFAAALSDWAAGRLSSGEAARMAAHQGECRACAADAEVERSLRAAFAALGGPAHTPDIRAGVAMRIEAERGTSPTRWSRAWAFGGALAAAASLGIVFVGSHLARHAPEATDVAQVREHRIVRMMANAQPATEAAWETAGADFNAERESQRVILTGWSGK